MGTFTSIVFEEVVVADVEGWGDLGGFQPDFGQLFFDRIKQR